MNGLTPTTISTRPNWADCAAQIMSQARESSNPAVRHSPCTQEIVGMGRSSMRWVMSIRRPMNPVASSGESSLNTFTSATPVKTLPSARTSSARMGSRATWSSRSTSSAVSSSPNRFRGGSSMTSTPRSPSRSKRTRSATELVRHLGQPVLVHVHRLARKAQRVALVARDHVHVEVEDGLPGRRLARGQEIYPVAAEPVSHHECQPLGPLDRPVEVLLVDLVQVAGVPAGDDQGVPARPRVDVHERHGVLVLGHYLGIELARGDLAEDAVVVRHAGGSLLEPAGLAEAPVQ